MDIVYWTMPINRSIEREKGSKERRRERLVNELNSSKFIPNLIHSFDFWYTLYY